MAATVIQLRRAIDEVDVATSTYTDAELAFLLTTETLYTAARDIWIEKMSGATGLVNMSEGGSSRSMAQAYDHIKDMVAMYTNLAAGEATGAPTGAVIRPIVRI